MDLNTINAFTKFSARFLTNLDQSKSVISSPLSAEFLLALLTLGTTEPAHSELQTCLGISDDDAIRATFTTVSEKLRSVKGVTLNVANKIYVMDGGYDLQAELKEDAIKVFDSEFEKVDFRQCDMAAKLINTWVEGKTNNRIKDLLSPDVLDDMTRLVLVNALYFKGSWKNKFNPQFTTSQPFFIDDKVINLPMMYKELQCKLSFSEGLKAQILELPYEGDEASMVIVLPVEDVKLASVLDTLSSGYDFASELSRLMPTKVQVSIPKFKIETSIDLKDLLQKLGIKAIFNTQGSGLTKILNNEEELYVSAALQKAFIEVNEEGAEAAAASAMMISARCAMMTPSFRADKPFIYMLLGPDRTPYFMGIYRGD